MWSGDLQGGYSTQWAFNPSAYQNLPNEQVDWATLAQQWIKMKETLPVDQVPPAPPPPSIKDDIAAGEAPMDVSKNDGPPGAGGTSQGGNNWSSWNSWQQWGWNWSGDSTSVAPVTPEKPAAVAPYTYASTTAPVPFSSTDAPATFDYNHGTPAPEQQSEYWSSNQAPYVRNKSSDWRGGQSRGSSSRRTSAPKVEEVEPDTTALFDAAKRKQLPAWIREGLEKMEREKHKQIERERMLKEKEEEMHRRKLEEEEALASGIPLKSKFDTDSEESEKEVAEEAPVKARKSRFDATSPVTVKPVASKPSPPPQPPVRLKNREEILQEVLQQVRYVLTNLLMSVTNEEMHKIAEEVHADFRSKAPATQLRKTPALTSLTGKLGLGIYDSDSAESSSESDEEPAPKQQNGVDSDEELRERIQRKKHEFARIERDIEYRVMLDEKREREREHASDEETTEESEDKSQVEAKPSPVGVRPDVKVHEPNPDSEPEAVEEQVREFFTPERPQQTEKESSEEQSEDSEQSSSSSETCSQSSSSTRYKKSRKYSRRKKDRKSSKKRRKRSLSRGSDRRKSSHRKSSHRHSERHHYDRERSRSCSRSRSRGHYDEYRRKRRHSSESSHHRHSRRHSYSRSPDYYRGKKSSHRSRD